MFLMCEYFLAPMLFEVNVTAASWKEYTASYVIFSIVPTADIPDIAYIPKLFMAVWKKTFDSEKAAL